LFVLVILALNHFCSYHISGMSFIMYEMRWALCTCEFWGFHSGDVEVFWAVTLCSALVGDHIQGEEGGSMDLWNVGILPQHYTVSQPRRHPLEALYLVYKFWV